MTTETSYKPAVLIIDDQLTNIQVLDAALSRNYDVTFATNGAQGIAMAACSSPELILLDVMMPGMDGFETCRRLRADQRLRDIPVIFISALEDVADKVNAFQAGGNDYVTKPFQTEEVLARVSTNVDLFRARQELLKREQRLQQNLTELGAAHAKLKEMSSQLLQSEKLSAIGQLAAGVAHEINNPIGFINSNLGSLKNYIENLLKLIDDYGAIESVATPELRLQIAEAKQRADLDFLRQDIGELIAESIEGASRVSRIVQHLRDFAHPGESEWMMVDLHTGLESAINMAWSEIQNRAEVVRDYGELPPVECLASQLNQVFLNLLLNAAQAMRDYGKITLCTRCEGDWVRISFSDSGCGIAQEHREKVFDPFFTTKPIGEGVGLGLSAVYGIVCAHGGRIEVISEPESGTTFTIRLPVNHLTGGVEQG